MNPDPGAGSKDQIARQAAATVLERLDLFARIDPDIDPDIGNVAAYGPAVIERIRQDGPAYGPTALVLLPTRELAIRTHEEFFQLSERGTTARIAAAFEGKPLTSQIGPLKHGADIVIGTPGRVLEHLGKRTLRIEQLKVFVIDRADEMFDLRLGRDLEAIIEPTPKTRQTILLTASAPPLVLKVAGRHLREPVLLGITREELDAVAPPEEPEEPMTNLYIGLGKGAGIKPRDLVGLVSNEGGLPGDRIGAIVIKQNFSLIAVPVDQAKGLVSRLRSRLVRGRKAKIRLERF